MCALRRAFLKKIRWYVLHKTMFHSVSDSLHIFGGKAGHFFKNLIFRKRKTILHNKHIDIVSEKMYAKKNDAMSE